ncbi:MAG TPA: replicative DNA helicase, partial [bacterium]
MGERREPIDELTLAAFMRSRNQLEQVGGLIYIAELQDMTPISANIDAYAQIVREKHQLRSLISAAVDIADRGRQSPGDAEGLIQQAEDIFLELANKATRRSFSPMSELLKASFEMLEKAQDQGDGLTGLPTGFIELDGMTNGLQKSDLIIIAARPGMGKTSFALNIAQHASVRSGKPTVVFSLEMSKEQMAFRMLCSEAKVDSQKVRKGELDEYEWDKLATAAAKLSPEPPLLFIDDTAEATPLAIKAISRRIQAEYGLGMIIVDYLQLMRAANRNESREQEIAEISRGLKALAKELDVPVIACAQLNRALEARGNKRPMLSDLRESGSIEQDADIVMFIYRDELYNPKTEDAGIAEIHIAKHRNGPVTHNPIRLAFVAEYTKFGNLALSREEGTGQGD